MAHFKTRQDWYHCGTEAPTQEKLQFIGSSCSSLQAMQSRGWGDLKRTGSLSQQTLKNLQKANIQWQKWAFSKECHTINFHFPLHIITSLDSITYSYLFYHQPLKRSRKVKVCMKSEYQLNMTHDQHSIFILSFIFGPQWSPPSLNLIEVMYTPIFSIISTNGLSGSTNLVRYCKIFLSALWQREKSRGSCWPNRRF